MNKKFLRLAKELSKDNQFTHDFSAAKNINEKFKIIKNRGFNCSMDEFKNFYSLLEKAYSLRNELSDDEIELVSGGVNMKTKLAALSLLGVTLLGVSGNFTSGITTCADNGLSLSDGERKSEINSETTTKKIEKLFDSIENLNKEKQKIENENPSEYDEEAAIKLSEIEEQIRVAQESLHECLAAQDAMDRSMVKTFVKSEVSSSEEQAKKLRGRKDEINSETITKEIEKLVGKIEKLNKEKKKIESGNPSVDDEGAAIKLSEIEEQIRVAQESLGECLDVKEAMDRSMVKTFVESEVSSSEEQAKNLRGIKNLGNTCFLNTALQILANAPSSNGRTFEKIFKGKGGFAIRNYKIHAYTSKNCPTLYGIYRFFNEKSDESKKVIEETDMEEIIEHLNRHDSRNKIYEGYQEDSTETLQRILDRIIDELDKAEKDKTLPREDRENFKNLKNSIFATFGFKYIDQDNSLVNDRFICPSQEIPEEKLNSNQPLSFKNVFDTNLIQGELPKNLIMQLPRKSFVNGNQVKLTNPIDIPELLDVNGKTYMIKNISMHLGGAYGGHYYSYTRIGDVWYELNDSRIEKCEEGAGILTQEEVMRNATNVVYECLD